MQVSLRNLAKVARRPSHKRLNILDVSLLRDIDRQGEMYPMHGVRDRDMMKAGLILFSLRKLEEKNLIEPARKESQTERDARMASAGPFRLRQIVRWQMRSYYSVTDKGRRVLRDWRH